MFVLTSTYDNVDRLASVTDPVGRITTYGYDALSRKISISNPAFGSPLAQMSYTPDGVLASLTNANGYATSFTPDGFDRLATTTYPNASTEVLTYDADGNILTRKTRANQTITYTYDTLNRLSTKAAPSEATVTNTYDLAGHLLSASDNSAAITAPTTGGTLSTITATYDALNHLISKVWSPVQAQAPPTSSTASFAYTYTAANQRLTQTATDNAFWSYPVTVGSTAYTHNNLDQYTAIGTAMPTYDGNGNLTFDGTTTFGYDAESRLITASLGTTTIATYAYDPLGHRKSQTLSGTTTILVNDQDNNPLLDYAGSGGAVQRWYVWGTGPNALLNQVNTAAGTRATLIPDIQGSIVGSLDSSTGTLTKAGFQSYGQSTTTANTNFGYTGSRIAVAGLYDMRARFYSPVIGRFLSTDPIGANGGVNLYAYAGNDPLNFRDPMGLTPESLGDLGAYAGMGVKTPPGIGLQEEMLEGGPVFMGGGGGFTQQIDEFAPLSPAVMRGQNSADFYVNSNGTAIPATGYRAIGGPAVEAAQNGNLMSGSGTAYITFNNISGLTGEQAGQLLQLPYTPTRFATFDTLQIANDLKIPGANWNTSAIPEPFAVTYPEYGAGGGTQAITSTPIQNYTLKPFP